MSGKDSGNQAPQRQDPAVPELKPAPEDERGRRTRMLAIGAGVIAIFLGVTQAVGGLNTLYSFYKNVVAMVSGEASDPPLTLVIVEGATRPAAGHQLVSFAPYEGVFGGGAEIRLALQSTSEKPLQVVRLAIEVERKPVETLVAFNDAVDPLAQPGFGAARPETFLVTIAGEKDGEVRYVRNDNASDPAAYPDLLPSNPPFVYHFQGNDRQATIDVMARLAAPGIYGVRFRATAIVDGKTHEVVSNEILLGKK